MMAKRKLENEFDISDITPSKSARVHGVVVGQISPIKSSKRDPSMKYFEGNLMDGKKTIRMVAFEPKIRAEIESARDKCQEILLSDVTVKKNARSIGADQLELLLGS